MQKNLKVAIQPRVNISLQQPQATIISRFAFLHQTLIQNAHSKR